MDQRARGRRRSLTAVAGRNTPAGPSDRGATIGRVLGPARVEFPGNDHSLGPDPWVDRQYLDYGPLLELLRHKRWVLRPHCVEVPDGGAKANLFRVVDGFVVPVVYAGGATAVRVRLPRFGSLAHTSELAIESIRPGHTERVEVEHHWVEDDLGMAVPVDRGCAIVHLRIVKR